MKRFLCTLLAAMALGAAMPSFAGNCTHDGDTASDGSRCGKRSSDSRPGGK